MPAKALCDDVTVDRDLPIYRWAIGQVIFIGGFIADGFHLPGRDDGALVDAKREGFQQRPLIAQKGGELFRRCLLDVGDGAKSGGQEFFLRDTSHAPKTAHGKGCEDFPFSAVGDDAEAVWLIHVTRHLGKEFIRRDADRGREMHGAADIFFDGTSDRAKRRILASHAGDVEEGFV